MAEIRPFRGWRFNPEIGEISMLTSPLFDISENSDLLKKYECPNNIVHISLPSHLNKAKAISEKWKEDKVLIQDPLPAIYPYRQTFLTPDNKEKSVTGFICNIKLHEWKEGIILRHESTMPHSVKERKQILESTGMNICPTHGLYTDDSLSLENFLDISLSTPLYHFKDSSGITNTLSVIQDLEVIKKFMEVLKQKQVIIADGHHRYEASLHYRNDFKTLDKNDPANFHTIYLTNTESNDFEIFPTHRLIKDIPFFNEEEIIQKLNDFFFVDFIDSPYKLENLLNTHKHSFGVIFIDRILFIRLKNGLENDIKWNFPKQIKELDLTILHYFIVDLILKIEGKIQKNSKNINFSFNFTKTISEVFNGNYQMAIITKSITKEEIKRVCYSGYTLPHKSTYFYPKVLCGLVLSSVNKKEFTIEDLLYKHYNE